MILGSSIMAAPRWAQHLLLAARQRAAGLVAPLPSTGK